MFLVEFNNGDIVKVTNIPQGVAAEKLRACGISEGALLEKISGDPLGHIVTVAFGNRCFAVTNDIAEIVEAEKV